LNGTKEEIAYYEMEIDKYARMIEATMHLRE